MPNSDADDGQKAITRNGETPPIGGPLLERVLQLRDQEPSALELLVEEAVDWAHCNGLVMRTPEHKDRSDYCQTAPFALTPSPFPRRLFDQAMGVQEAMNLLYHRVSFDTDFLVEAHREVVHTDDFVRRMINILVEVQQGVDGKVEGKRSWKQRGILLTQRADYMCHVGDGDGGMTGLEGLELKQIEVNNIAVSMGGLAQQCTRLHRRLARQLLPAGSVAAAVTTSPDGRDATKGGGGGEAESATHLPSNKPIHETIARGLYEGWRLYADSRACILVVTDEVNQNQPDQRHVEFAVEELAALGAAVPGGTVPAAPSGSWDVPRFIRLTLAQCHECLSLDETTGSLQIPHREEKGDKERSMGASPPPLPVAVVYFRSGYTPSQYPTEREWAARLLIERSCAIKCPWMGLQLANTKKVQQVLTNPEVLARFVPHPETVTLLHATFAGLWGFGDETTSREEQARVVRHAMENPHLYVLKPNLEGGGGNYYGETLTQKLKEFSADELSAHILMQRIEPLVVKNYLVRPFQEPQLAECVSELGVYGYLLAESDGRVLQNQVHGHILRTKAKHVDEGGVAVGASVIDTPYLI